MPYDIEYEEKLEEEFGILRKRDKCLYEAAMKKILKIAEDPFIGKPLRNTLKGRYRVHVGHFVIIYMIKNEVHRVVISKFVHHDNAYK